MVNDIKALCGFLAVFKNLGSFEVKTEACFSLRSIQGLGLL